MVGIFLILFPLQVAQIRPSIFEEKLVRLFVRDKGLFSLSLPLSE